MGPFEPGIAVVEIQLLEDGDAGTGQRSGCAVVIEAEGGALDVRA